MDNTQPYDIKTLVYKTFVVNISCELYFAYSIRMMIAKDKFPMWLLIDEENKLFQLTMSILKAMFY